MALGVLLVLGWAVWAAMTWQSQLRYVTLEDYQADLAGGHVTTFRMVSDVRPARSWPASGAGDQFDLPALDSHGQIDRTNPVPGVPTLLYTTDHRVGPLRVLDPGRFSGYAETAVQQARAAGVPAAGQASSRSLALGDTPQLVGIVVGLLSLLAVVLGPRPTSGTRWFWLWMLWLVGGLGVVAYAVSEPLRQARLRGRSLDGDHPVLGGSRLRGWQGWLGAVAVSTVLGFLVGPRGTHLDGIFFPHW